MLYYFNHPSEVVNGDARCLIPLQNLRVGTSEIDDPTGCTFQMVDSNGGPIKTMKGGQMGQHTRLVLRAETKEDCEAWKVATTPSPHRHRHRPSTPPPPPPHHHKTSPP